MDIDFDKNTAVVSQKNQNPGTTRVEVPVTIQEAGKKYIEFVSPSVKSSKIKTSDSRSLSVKAKIR